jgi:hypothetical protein
MIERTLRGRVRSRFRRCLATHDNSNNIDNKRDNSQHTEEQRGEPHNPRLNAPIVRRCARWNRAVVFSDLNLTTNAKQRLPIQSNDGPGLIWSGAW